MAEEDAAERHSVTSILKASDPLWWWLRENFKLPSIVALLTCFATASGWIYTQHLDLRLLKEHDPGPKLEQIAGQLEAVLQAQSAMQQRLEDFGQRVDRQESRWDRVDQVAQSTPHKRTRPR